MARLALIVLLAGAVLFALVVLGLGTFPPHAPTQPVDRVLPNDRFQTH